MKILWQSFFYGSKAFFTKISMFPQVTEPGFFCYLKPWVHPNICPETKGTICFLFFWQLKQSLKMMEWNHLPYGEYLSKSHEFSVPQIKYPQGGSSKKGSHVYFLLMVAMVLLLWCQIVLHMYCDIRTFISDNSTIWQNNSITQKTCNRKYRWLPFCYCPLVGILFEVLRIVVILISEGVDI